MSDPIAPYASVVSAAIGALVSAGVAWFTARRSVRTEIDKLRLSVQQKLLEQLVAARLVAYPELYSMMSELVKAAAMQVNDPDFLRDLLQKVNIWDSRYSILLGPHTTNVCYEFRHALAKAASLPAMATIEHHESGREAAEVLRMAMKLELALRSDLGIYGVEVTQAPDALRMPRVESY